MLGKLFFSLIIIIYVVVWGKLLWFCSERSRFLNKLVFKLMSNSKSSNSVIKSKVLSVIYFVYSVVGFILLAIFLKQDVFTLFSFQLITIPLALLGFLVQIMLISLLLEIMLPYLKRKISGRITEQVGEAPWIRGISEMRNPVLVTIVPGISGFFEEIFFRGCLLFYFINYMYLEPWLAVVLVTLLFLYQQLMQLNTLGQKVIIGLSCIIISISGSLMFLYTGSILPAALAHASFAIFYVSFGNDIA